MIICPVCKKNVTLTTKSLIETHNGFEKRICYGSYMPMHDFIAAKKLNSVGSGNEILNMPYEEIEVQPLNFFS
jgi:hypothetical protein